MTHTANNDLTTGPGAMPENWPPQPADIWSDRYHNTWAVLGAGKGRVEMCATDGAANWRNPDEVQAVFGPLRLEYRPEPNERATTFAGLRAMADFLEAHPELPRPYGFAGQLEAESDDQVREFAERFGLTTRDAGTQFKAEISFANDVRFTFVHFRPRPEPEPVATQPIAAEQCDCFSPVVPPIEPDAEQTAIVEEDAAERRTVEAESLAEVEDAIAEDLANWKPEHGFAGGTFGGENSVTCLCGVTYAGFDTHAEAMALLERHIADPGYVPAQRDAAE